MARLAGRFLWLLYRSSDRLEAPRRASATKHAWRRSDAWLTSRRAFDIHNGNAPVHIIGGGLAGQRGGLADRPRRRARRAARDAAGARDRRASDRAAGRTGLLQLVPLRRSRATTPSACCIEEMRRAGSLILRAADANRCRPAARWRWTATASRAAVDGGARRPSADRDRARGNRRPAARRLGQRHHRHRPADLAGARRRHPAR